MIIDYTKHAKTIVLERSLKAKWIEKCITAPEKTHINQEDAQLTHYLLRIDENQGRVLRVVARQQEDRYIVVTAYFDRKMKGRIL